MMTEQAHIQADVDVRIAVIDDCLQDNLKANHHAILGRMPGWKETFIRLVDGARWHRLKGCSFVTARKDCAANFDADTFETSYVPMLLGAYLGTPDYNFVTTLDSFD